jgi:hypothetical protein
MADSVEQKTAIRAGKLLDAGGRNGPVPAERYVLASCGYLAKPPRGWDSAEQARELDDEVRAVLTELVENS